MIVGEKDLLGRTLKRIRGREVLVKSKQSAGLAVCESEKEPGVPCDWVLESNNATGVAAQHAASWGHRVKVTRSVVTEYDGETPKRGLDTPARTVVE